MTTRHVLGAVTLPGAYPEPMNRTRRPVSVVCVFNRPEVLRDCLERSIEDLRAQAPDVELIAVDNTEHRFTSAGAALNHGARAARHDYVAFVHQDVYLHSLVALEEAAGFLADDPGIGLLGACGIDASGGIVGPLRDRVVLIGDQAPQPRDVDSLDEVLFMIPRATVLDDPLSEQPELAWHAYAVEYGLRMRESGRRVCAVDLPVTHNSLTVNLDKLDVAHAAVARRYPSRLPVRTTCGVVTDRTDESLGREPFLAGHRWRYRWLRDSRPARAAGRSLPDASVVLADIRLDVDDVIAALDGPLLVVNVDPAADRWGAGQRLVLHRKGLPVAFTAARVPDLAGVLDGAGPALVTNLGAQDLAALRPVADASTIVGYHEAMGFWVLLGCPAGTVPPSWEHPRATPFGLGRRSPQARVAAASG